MAFARFSLALAALASPGVRAGVDNDACRADFEPKRRVVLSWGGELDSDAFKASLKNFHRRFKGVSDLHLAAWQRGALDLPSDVVPVRATPEGLKDALERIRADFAAHPTEPPEAYEVLLLVTNHGTRWVGESEDFGFTGDDSALTRAQLRDFGRGLPKGVRFKALVGACYGQDSLGAIVAGMRERGNACACGVASAAPGAPALGVESGARPWEDNSLNGADAEASLFERRWSEPDVSIGRFPRLAGNAPDNSFLSTSEQEMIEALKARYPELRGLAVQDIEAKAAALHRRQVEEGGGLPEGTLARLKNSRRAQERVLARLLRQEAGTPELARAKREALEAGVFATVYVNGHRVTAAKVAARQLLEEVFLKEASIEEKARFWAARDCELLPLRTSPDDASAAPDEH